MTTVPASDGPRRLVLCLDGTNNEIGRAQPTNPAKVFQMLDLEAPSRQLAYYDPGVGTMPSATARGRLEKQVSLLAQLGFGAGLRANVVDAYAWLMQHWRQGDQIYLFGFSRGAYTARAVAGLLQRPGLMRRGSENLIPYAVATYAGGRPRSAEQLAGIRQFADSFCWGRPDKPLGGGVAAGSLPGGEIHSVPIHYAGLWDTVEAAGLFRHGDLGWPFTHTLDNVETIRHAVSIDEARPPFRDFLDTDGHPQAQEVWFSGVHSDVGGTHVDDARLSTIALRWVVQGAPDLVFRPGAFDRECRVSEPDALAPPHRNGRAWRLLPSRPRRPGPATVFHSSVRLRAMDDPAFLPGVPRAPDCGRWTDPEWAGRLTGADTGDR